MKIKNQPNRRFYEMPTTALGDQFPMLWGSTRPIFSARYVLSSRAFDGIYYGLFSGRCHQATFGDVARCTWQELCVVRNVGNKSIDELERFFQDHFANKQTNLTQGVINGIRASNARTL